MKICDDCGYPTNVAEDPASGMIICADCAKGNKMTTEESIAKLEADGVNVGEFMKRIHATIQKANVRAMEKAKLEKGGGE